jgi:hypothetical protein
MPRKPARWTQTELDRAARAVDKAKGQIVAEFTPDGTFRIVPADKQQQPVDDTPLEEWERKYGQG